MAKKTSSPAAMKQAALQVRVRQLERELAEKQAALNEALRQRNDEQRLRQAAERGLARSIAGECLKCGIGPRRETCAYPQACEHPGRVAALERNQALSESAPDAEVTLVRKVLADWLLGKLSDLAALIVIDALLNPAPPSADDMTWATRRLAARRIACTSKLKSQ